MSQNIEYKIKQKKEACDTGKVYIAVEKQAVFINWGRDVNKAT